MEYHPKTMAILDILEGGLLDAHNRDYPGLQVHVNDKVSSLNGVRFPVGADYDSAIRQCQTARLGILREPQQIPE